MKTNNRFALKAAIVSIVTAATVYGCAQTFQLGIDEQTEVRSLDHQVFIINKRDKKPNKGEYVAYHPTANEYFDQDAIFVKKVAALAGDTVHIIDGYQRINHGDAEFLHLLGTLKKGINALDRTHTLDDDEFWAMGTTKNSYDSRYSGAVPASNIVGKAYPIF